MGLGTNTLGYVNKLYNFVIKKLKDSNMSTKFY